MKMIHLRVQAGRLVFSMLSLVSFSGMAQEDLDAKLKSILNETVPFIYSEELRSKIESGQKILILDTRQPEEYQVSHIPGAVFINYNNFSEDMVEGYSRELSVVTYCAVGYRSEKIGEKLVDLGFKNVQNLYGGIFEWKNKGNEVVNEGGVTDSVHTYNKKWSQWLKNGIKVYE